MIENNMASVLSEREVEVLNEIYWLGNKEGFTDLKKVAEKLKIAQSTVKSHLRIIYRKLSVNDLTSAIIVAKDVLQVI